MKIRPTSHNITIGVVEKTKQAKELGFKWASKAMQIVTERAKPLKGRAVVGKNTTDEQRTTRIARSRTKDVPPAR